jgi:hypothetical protein
LKTIPGFPRLQDLLPSAGRRFFRLNAAGFLVPFFAGTRKITSKARSFCLIFVAKIRQAGKPLAGYIRYTIPIVDVEPFFVAAAFSLRFLPPYLCDEQHQQD